jgi:hypothetical protein
MFILLPKGTDYRLQEEKEDAEDGPSGPGGDLPDTWPDKAPPLIKDLWDSVTNADNCIVDLEKIKEVCEKLGKNRGGRGGRHDSTIGDESPELSKAKVALHNLKWAFSKGFKRSKKNLLKALSGHTVPDIFVYLCTDQRRYVDLTKRLFCILVY